MITSTFNSELNILETEFKGVLTNKDIIDYLSSFNEKNSYPKTLKIIVDATEASAKFSFSEINNFNNEKNKFMENYDNVVCATIINNPSTAAIASLYSTIANSKNYKFNVFSSHKAALIWINSFN